MEKFLRHDGVFLLRLMTLASNALTTVDLTGALWKKYWKSYPPPSDVILSGADPSTVLMEGRRQAGDLTDESTVKRKPHDDQHLKLLASS